MEPLLKWMIWGVPPFSETPIWPKLPGFATKLKALPPRQLLSKDILFLRPCKAQIRQLTHGLVVSFAGQQNH